MSTIEKLMDSAIADVDVLRSLNSQGDDFRKFRGVDFLFVCPTQERAELVASFINDYRYGDATAHESDGRHLIEVRIVMPVEQNLILSVSGFMTCLADLYGIDFDGWGCASCAPPRDS